MTGRILSIGNIEQIPFKDGSGKTFDKRTVVLNCSRSLYGETYENYPSFEFAGKHVDDPTHFKVGDIVDVSFVVQGKKSLKDNQPTAYFNTVAGYQITLHQRSPQPAQNQAIQGNEPQQTKGESDDLPF